MTDIVLSTFFTVVDRVLTTVDGGFDLPVTTYIGQPAYGIVTLGTALPIAIDLNKLVSVSEFVTPALTYRDLAIIYFQNHDASNLSVEFLPKLDRTTQKFAHRLEVFDPRAETGWTIDFGDVDNPTITSDLDRVGTLDDLILTGPSDRVLDNILVAVNGVLHKTVVFENRLYVLDGYATVRQSGHFEICAVDTTTVGGHQVIPITEDMIRSTETEFMSYTNISISPVLLDGHSVLFSMDGYLQVFNNFYNVRDRSTITLRPNRLDYIENFLYHPSMRRTRDVLAVTNVSNPYDPSNTVSTELGPRYRDRNDALLFSFVGQYTVPRETLTSYDFFKQRLMSPHSFVILINNPHLYLTEYQLITRGEERMFECYIEDMPRGLFLYGRGYLYPYTTTFNLNSNQHLIFLDQGDRKAKIYQSGMNSPAFPAPYVDYTDSTLRPDARMIEIVAGKSGP